ncbi:MAG: TauD/TfdA family dioxygenase [Candidatus Solibacter sp.]
MEHDKGLKASRFAGVRPKAVRLAPAELVKKSRPAEGRTLPIVLGPAVEGVDLRAWASANREYIEGLLLEYGGVLLRDFRVDSLENYEQIAQALCRETIEYGERSSPRTKLTGRIYTSTDHPSDQPIQLHNEQSYTLNWPMKIFFHCAVAPVTGGATPIADCRRIYQRLDAALLEEFLERKILYVRNYGEGLGLSWQVAFQTDHRNVVEEHCRDAGIEFEWGAGEKLRTRQVRPAIRPHPQTGEALWFNHGAFFHFSSLTPQAQANILAVLDREDVPFDTFYGDGGRIDDATLAALRQAYAAETVRFDWRKGDILMLDNMLACHGRDPFTGPRKVAVAMGDPFQSLQAKEQV